MTEAERAGQIRLSVDQEVFIDSILSGDTVEDANVATEVTSFERVGDAYVLEGAIVFAAYVSKDNGSSPAGSDGADRRHIHHRMPFMLRVPVAHQPRGVVNVASRISDWQLDVLSEGWLRVQAELFVNGLNGKHGFHFQCGAQEEGDVFFGANPQSVLTSKEDKASATSDASDQSREAEQDTAAPDEAFSLTRGNPGDWRSLDSPDGDASEAAERYSQARGGADDGEDATQSSDEASQQPRAVQSEGGPSEKTAREELADFDRFVPEQFSTDVRAGDDSQARNQGINEPSAVNQAQGSVEALSRSDEASEASEFEFEHQADVSKLQPMGHTSAAAHASETGEVTESFVPSRSFAEDGFQATAGFVPEIKVAAQEPTTDSEEAEAAENRGLVDTSMWSFVDFNAPDSFVTLRYLVAMEEESIGSLAERAGCSEAELIHANNLRGEGVVPGQILRVPLPSLARR